MKPDYYPNFVDEVFIKPIRSVLIVDDDYPTFDEMLDARIAEEEGRDFPRSKGWYSNPRKIKKVIESFRTPQRPLLVDIHDGANVTSGDEIKIASHLHQSDLLVLDYQLDRNKKDDGSLAIEIIRNLASNQHFNLVVLHTSSDIDVVFRAILVSLMCSTVKPLNDDEGARVLELLEAAEIEREGVISAIERSVLYEQYFYSIQETKYLSAIGGNRQPLLEFVAACPNEWEVEDKKLVFRYQLGRFERKISNHFWKDSNEIPQWSADVCKWIKMGDSFHCVL